MCTTNFIMLSAGSPSGILRLDKEDFVYIQQKTHFHRVISYFPEV